MIFLFTVYNSMVLVYGIMNYFNHGNRVCHKICHLTTLKGPAQWHEIVFAGWQQLSPLSDATESPQAESLQPSKGNPRCHPWALQWPSPLGSEGASERWGFHGDGACIPSGVWTLPGLLVLGKPVGASLPLWLHVFICDDGHSGALLGPS